MAGEIRVMTAIAALVDADIFEVTDDVGGTPLTRKATLTVLEAWLKTTGFLTDSGIFFLIDGGGSVITTGLKGDIRIPFGCTIDAVTLLADQSGSIVIDIWKDTYANYPPLVGDSITASAKPTITTALKSTDATLTGWTKTITKDESLRINVDSVTTIERVALMLNVTKT